MHYSIKLIIVFVSCISCSCRSYEFKTTKIKTVELVNSTDRRLAEDVIEYHFEFPKSGFQNKSLKNDHSVTMIFTYKDSSLIYFNEDQLSVTPNTSNIELMGGVLRKSLYDTAYYSGIQKDGRVWKEHVLGEIIIGYLNVPSQRKEEFDTALASIAKIKTTRYVNGRKVRKNCPSPQSVLQGTLRQK
jgi:hypothetical protein